MSFIARASVIALLLISTLFSSASSIPTSSFIAKKKLVDKHLSSKISFEKKLKVLRAFESWIDKEILSRSDKLNEEDLTQLMQYSNLMRAANLKSITEKNCQLAGNRVTDEDLTPASEGPSAAAQTILGWIKFLCPKK